MHLFEEHRPDNHVHGRIQVRRIFVGDNASPTPTAPIQIFSASSVRCRPTRIASPMGGRARSSVRSRTSSGTSRRRTQPRDCETPGGAVSRGPVPVGGESGLKCATSAPQSGWCSRLKDCRLLNSPDRASERAAQRQAGFRSMPNRHEEGPFGDRRRPNPPRGRRRAVWAAPPDCGNYVPDVTIVCPNWFFAIVAADSQRTSGSVSV